MSRYLTAIALLLLISLTYFGMASSAGPETSTISLDQIKSEVSSSLDLGNSNVEQTAVTIAKDYPGEYNINQVCQIFDTLRKGWFYFSDPSYKNKYKNANRTLQDGKMSNTIGMGNCDDFAILMASLIASLGGSTRITFASNASSTEGHAYCEVFLGYKNDSQVDRLINWTKAEYSLKDVPGLNKTGNEVWLNLDWWTDNPGGPYFEGDERVIVWLSDKLTSPKIVPMIDTMDSTVGWQTINDSKGSNVSIGSYPARKGLGIAISYNLKESGWVGISRNVTPAILSQVAGLNFSCLAIDKQNTIEMHLAYSNGTEFGYFWKPDLGKWAYLEALYEDFKCLGSGNGCSPNSSKVDSNDVKKLEIIISNQTGDGGGSGKALMDNIQGEMNIPAGSPWARAEKQREITIANDLSSKSNNVLSASSNSLELSILLAVESLKHFETSVGYSTLRRIIGLMPRCITRLDNHNPLESVAFSPDGKMVACGGLNFSLICDSETGEAFHFDSYSWMNYFKHSGSVLDVTFSSDNTKLATGSSDNTCKIWGVDETDKSISELHNLEHAGAVRCVAFSPNGKKLATASDDNTSGIWDVKSGQELNILRHEGKVKSVIFSPNGKMLATISDFNSAEIWDVATGKEILELNDNCSITSVAFSSDCRMIAATCLSSQGSVSAKIIDPKNGKELHNLEHRDELKYVLFSPDNRALITASDNYIHQWDIKSEREYKLINIGTDSKDFIKFSSNGEMAAIKSADDPNACGVWDIEAGSKLFDVRLDNEITSAAFSPNCKEIATASWDNICKLWDVQTGTEHISLDSYGQVISAIFSPDGARLITVSTDGMVKASNVNNGSEAYEIFNQSFEPFRKSNWRVPLSSFSPDGEIFALTGPHGNTIRTWKIIKNYNDYWLSGKDWLNQNGEITSMTFSPDGTKLATGSTDKTSCIWDLRNGSVLRLGHNDVVLSVAFSPDGRKLASVSEDGYAKIWDIQRGLELSRLSHIGLMNRVGDFGQDGRLNTSTWGTSWVFVSSGDMNQVVAFSQDGMKLATSTWGTIWIWDIRNRSIANHLDHDNLVNDIVFSPDGKKVATSSDDGTARIWDIETGSELKRLNHSDPVGKIVFSPDGKILATECGYLHYVPNFGIDNNIHIWNATDGSTISSLNHDANITSILFDPEGQKVITASHDGIIKIWEVKTGEELLRLDCKSAVIALSFSKDGKELYSANLDGLMRIWSIETGKLLGESDFDWAPSMSSASLSPDGKKLALIERWGKNISIADIQSGKELYTINYDDYPDRVLFSPDNRTLCYISNNTIFIWDIPTGKRLHNLTQDSLMGDSVIFSSDGKIMASGSWRNISTIWNVSSGEKLKELKSMNQIDSYAFSPDGLTLMIFSEPNITQIHINHLSQGINNWTFPGGFYQYSSNENLAVSYNKEAFGILRVKLWKGNDWDSVIEIELEDSEFINAEDLIFSPDWTKVAAQDSYNNIHIWDMETGKKLHKIVCDNFFDGMWFSPDGKILVGVKGKGFRFFDTEIGIEFQKLDTDVNIGSFAFSPDFKNVAIPNEKHQVKIWPISREGLISEACSRLDRNLTLEEWHQYVGDEPYRETCTCQR